MFNRYMTDDASFSDPAPSSSAQSPADIPAIKNGEIARGDHQGFTAQIERLIREAEELRLRYMKKHQTHNNLALSVGLICMLIGAGGFGWFLLMEANLVHALGSIVLAIIIPLFLNLQAGNALKNYRQAYKSTFLPQLAHALGGFQFYTARGISEKLIRRTGILPQFDRYASEDCFMGRYKGVKVIFSEAQLYSSKQGKAPVFNGIFVLLETPDASIEGHTILTANQEHYRSWRGTRWKQLQDIPVQVNTPAWDRFKALSDTPESAGKLITEKLLKELSEAADIYDSAPLSAAFFAKKLIFIMIPYEGDMFEPSTLHLPIATRQHALQCKREVEQILEVIDVFELYQKPDHAAAAD